MGFLKKRSINAVFHYVPLHSSPMCNKHCRVSCSMSNTDNLSDRILHLPVFYEMTQDQVSRVTCAVRDFYCAASTCC